MAPCQWWDGLRKKSGSFCSFERQLLVFTLLESGPSKWACSGGKYCCLGALMGVPGVPVGWYIAPRQGWDRLRKKMVHLAVFSQNYWSLSSQKVAEENRLVLGMIFVVWGLPGGPQGSKAGSPGSHLVNTWPLASAEMGWEKKVVHLAVLREIYWSLHRLRKFAIWLHPKKSKNCAR